MNVNSHFILNEGIEKTTIIRSVTHNMFYILINKNKPGLVSMKSYNFLVQFILV